jgi:pilus assembly protein Flp/PilA
LGAIIEGDEPMALISSLLPCLIGSEEGQGLAEYALILALVAILAIVALLFMGGRISATMSFLGSSV